MNISSNITSYTYNQGISSYSKFKSENKTDETASTSTTTTTNTNTDTLTISSKESSSELLNQILTDRSDREYGFLKMHTSNCSHMVDISLEFYSGEASLEDVTDEFIKLADAYIDEQYEKGFTDKERLLEIFYENFRSNGVNSAVNHTYNEAEKIIESMGDLDLRGGGGYQAVKYYSADDYYKCEDFIATITNAAKEYSKENFGTEFEERDYLAEELWYSANYNTHWGNPLISETTDIMIDLSVPPPEGFTFLSIDTKKGLYLSVGVEDENGKQIVKELTTNFDDNDDEFSNLADIIQFGKEDIENSAYTDYINNFIKNINIFSYRGWCLKHPMNFTSLSGDGSVSFVPRA